MTAGTDSPLRRLRTCPLPRPASSHPPKEGQPTDTNSSDSGAWLSTPCRIGRESACGVREALQQSWGKATPCQALCEFWAFPSLESGASAGWSSHVKELLQQPKLKTPSKLRKSQVQTNNYKAGGREGKQTQAFLK